MYVKRKTEKENKLKNQHEMIKNVFEVHIKIKKKNAHTSKFS